MNRFVSAVWRWILILCVYAVIGIPIVGLVIPGASGQSIEIPMLFQRTLRRAATAYGFFPDNMYYDSWQFWLSGYAMNALILSLALVAVWNILYSPNALGRNYDKSARFSFVLFIIIHVAALLYLAYLYFTSDSNMWLFVSTAPFSRSVTLLLPQLLLVPYVVVIRALCPYRIYHVFNLASRIRRPLRLRVYRGR